MMFTDEQVTDAVKAAVAERGKDYVYPVEWLYSVGGMTVPNACRYVQPDGSGPACIVGYVLHRLGVPLVHLTEVEGGSAYGIAIEFCSTKAARALNKMQRAQDTNDTWGVSANLFMQEMDQ